jgi:outer membrane protein TolC
MALTAFCLVSGATDAFGADTSDSLSVEKAVQEGLGQSPTIKKYEASSHEASWGKLLGMSTLLPHLDIKGEHDFSTEYQSVPVSLGSLTAAVPEVYPKTSLGIEASWTLFDGLANINTYRASLDTSRAADLEASRKTYEVRKKIELAFFKALAAQRFEEVAEENVKTLQENLSQVRFRLESGVATKYDVLRVEVQLSDANTDLERTQDDVIIERKNLAETMGMSVDERPLSGELPTPTLSGQIQKLPAPQLNQREDFQAAELRSEAADKQAAASTGALIPSIGLIANYETYENTDYPAEAYGGYRDAWNIGVGFKWNIFDGGATIARSGMAHASATRAANEYEETVLTLPTDYELWKRRYIYSEHHFFSKSQDLTRSEESFRISKASFQQGRKTITDVLEAETDLFRSRAGVVQSQLDAEEALLKLELTIGKDI